MRRTSVVLAVLLALACVARPASAGSITQFVSFSGSAFDATLVTPFNPALGTLDRVFVGISGQLSVTGQTFPWVVGNPAFPVPYDYRVVVDQSFFGLAGKYFSFVDPGRFQFDRQASGLGEPFTLVTAFTYGFNLTAFSDSAGFTLASVSSSAGVLTPPLSGITGQRADFLPGVVPIDEIDMVQTVSATSPNYLAPTITGFNTNALMEITYFYTSPLPQPVPEPGTLLLISSGAAAWAVRRKRTGRRERATIRT